MKYLNDNPNHKIVVGLNYNNSIEQITNILLDANMVPLFINGFIN